jgi:hypothetical protein
VSRDKSRNLTSLARGRILNQSEGEMIVENPTKKRGVRMKKTV